ncbi:DUF4983 domain-containing protein [Chitinophaga solisilvae]|uniref:DUF4983 domain-containing protein n=1 Tax=Chitinophaga solisilvae TaxID=1233460 RepID=A0A3S1D1D0_9BACT|nr:DUF4983 domain-containing protein [Chitinophaga solisilvae]NSL87575.1 DUF4983 domain-containing protein [Chitinophaga solisilvae]
MNKIISLIGTAAVLLTLACNKESADTLNGREYPNNPGITAGTPKVLCLVIDGARGESVKALKPPVLWALRDSAVFTWNGISDTTGTAGNSWADLLTGVGSNKHGVIGNDYTNINTKDHPVFFKYLKDGGITTRAAAFMTTPEVSQQLIGSQADVSNVFTTDDAVQAAVQRELQQDSAGVILAEFGDVEKAGRQFGYDVSIPQYAAAITAADKKIGEILNALRARKNFGRENWLVVITSGHGGYWPVAPEESDGTAFSNPVQNTFTLFFNPRFESQVIARPENIRVAYEGKAVRLWGPESDYVRAECDDQGLYNVGKGQMTVEIKIKKTKNASGNYSYSHPPFFGKCNNRSGSTPGWAFFHSGEQIVFYVSDGITNRQVRVQKNLNDGDWHSITGTIQLVGTTYELAVFVDGENKTTDRLIASPVASTTGIISPSKTIIGFFPTTFGSTLDFYPSDVRIFNTVVSDEMIKRWAAKTYVNRQHPNYGNLIGYWSCLDGEGSRLTDQSPSKKNFDLKGKYAWSAFSDMSNYLYPQIANQERFVPNTVDIPLAVINWMKVPVQTGWGLESKGWPATFRDFPVSVIR